MENVKRFVKPTRWAEMIDAGKSKVYSMIKKGEIPTVEIGGMIRVDVEKALAKLNIENEASEAR